MFTEPPDGDSAGRPGLTLIVVAFHRQERLARLLESAVGQADRVIVVNVEDDPAVAKVAADNGADLVALHSNLGYAAGVNTGVSLVDTPLVVFANDDLELAAGCLATLAAELCRGADVAVPRLYRPDGRVEASIARLVTPAAILGEWVLLPDDPPRFLPDTIVRHSPVQKWRRPIRTEPIAAAEAALVATHTNVLSRLPLPEEYFLYWEEHEWFHRLRADGGKVVYVPAASATHVGWDEVGAAKARLLADNAVRCLAATGGRRAAVLGWPMVVAWWTRLCAVDAGRSALRPSAANRARLATRWVGLRAAVGAWHRAVSRSR